MSVLGNKDKKEKKEVSAKIKRRKVSLTNA